MSGERGRPTVLVVGAAGQVGTEVLAAASGRLDVRGLTRRDLDVTRPRDVRRTIVDATPDVVLNLAAWTDVDGAESHVEEAFRVNRDGAAFVASACAAGGAHLVHLSTDYVFAGDAGRPYAEQDPTGPVNAYGESKLAGERSVLDELPAAVVVRTAAVHSAHGANFVRSILAAAEGREELRVVDDQRTSPTAAPHLAEMLVALAGRLAGAGDARAGVPAGPLHWTDEGEASWFELAEEAIARAREHGPLRVERVVPVTTEEYGAPAARPRYSVLDCSRAESLGFTRRSWRTGVRRVVDEVVAGRR